MEQLATDAVKSYPQIAIPLVFVGLLIYWFLGHLRWIEENRNKTTTDYTAVCNKNAEAMNRSTEMLGRAVATLDRLDAKLEAQRAK